MVEADRGLPVEVCNDHRANQQSPVCKYIAQAQHVLSVRDAQVTAHLVALDVFGRDDDDNLCIVLQLHEHPQLTVWLETRQDAAGVVVVIELTAKLHIEFVAELSDALLDVLRLDAEVFLIVKTYFHL